MKRIVFPNRKGGVGKSAILCQLAYYLADLLGLRVLVLDLDHQANASKAIGASGLATVSAILSSRILTERVTGIEDAKFVLVPGDELLTKLEKRAADHNQFAGNLQAFFQAVDGKFDVCLTDTNPTPDVRMMVSLVLATYVLSPVQLNQEAIDGIAGLTADIKKVKMALNNDLIFMGILPNLVEAKPFQKANFAQVAEHYANLLIRLNQGGFALIKARTAIAEAQAAGVPVWKLGKTSAVECWRELKPVFDQIAANIGVKSNA
ncbi:MAG: ParA family protein, partial [Betaproteobacteria bacterium]|nr:ParA family protein [Betaproteobacteria bacterium]